MSTPIQPTLFLRRVWLADAAVSLAVGALMAFAAAPLNDLLGLPTDITRVAGLSLFPYAAFLVWLARRAGVPRGAAWAPIVLNVVWAIECLAVLLATSWVTSGPGRAFVALQIVTVLVFAELETMGLRRSPVARPA